MASGRELQFERLLFFSDAVFAIAITLLVIEVKVPEIEHVSEAALRAALRDLFPNYIGFLLSFFVIGRFWIGHHRIFGYLKDWDNGLVRINLLFLATIAFMPFPTAVIGAYGGTAAAGLFYIGWLLFAGVVNLLLVTYVARKPALLAAPLTPQQRHELRSVWLPIVIGLAALVATQVSAGVAIVVLTLSPLLFSLVLRGLGRRHRAG